MALAAGRFWSRGLDVGLVRRHCSMGAHLAGCEMAFGVSEDVVLRRNVSIARTDHPDLSHSQNVDGAHDKDDDSRSNHDAPKWKTQAFLTCCLLVEVPQDTDSKGDHCKTEHDKARSRAEERPVSREVGFEKREFSEDEKSWGVFSI